MNRAPIVETLARIEGLANEINQHVPSDRPSLNEFRSDLAGLLTVTSCATYENCVKLILQDYAGRQSNLFRVYAENQYDKINSRIDIRDLHKYCKTFHPNISRIFKDKLEKSKRFYLERANSDITESYGQLLKWRHSFAHSGARITTVEEVLRHHQLGKRVIILFSDAFAEFPPSTPVT
ncbi:hypothetical protein K3175_02150 [Qipengyuania sp. GH1]|uniref:HEPN domain-containing protein n=1 Tax=Qipengyuania aestuarii TaxID=2867241 RepID=UPI001C883A38|nr:HEPN domain-containing protein [Qipengyuania aestuarii]MBX7534456.1 hypothetical protein [Qipengyuania aestuarii]